MIYSHHNIQISTRTIDMYKIAHPYDIMNTTTLSTELYKHTVSTDEHAHSSMRKLNLPFAEMNLL
jgi:hypothetical protein